VIGRYGGMEAKEYPCTWGFNEKAGMNEEELDKYITNSILPLYPDVCDCEQKHVIIRCDTSPGRSNVAMLAKLRSLGVYLVPGVPNTMHVMQETDQNYGRFKSDFRFNLSVLSEVRFAVNKTLTMSDIPLLVFGGQSDGVVLVDAFAKSFNSNKNKEVWKSIGAVPLM